MSDNRILMMKPEIDWSDEYKKLCNENARLVKYLQYAYRTYNCDEALEVMNEFGIDKHEDLTF